MITLKKLLYFNYFVVVNECGNLGPFDSNKGNVVFNNNKAYIGTIARFQCFSGYKLIGVKERVCKKDGMWSDVKNPTCTGTYSLNLKKKNPKT